MEIQIGGSCHNSTWTLAKRNGFKVGSSLPWLSALQPRQKAHSPGGLFFLAFISGPSGTCVRRPAPGVCAMCSSGALAVSVRMHTAWSGEAVPNPGQNHLAPLYFFFADLAGLWGQTPNYLSSNPCLLHHHRLKPGILGLYAAPDKKPAGGGWLASASFFSQRGIDHAELASTGQPVDSCGSMPAHRCLLVGRAAVKTNGDTAYMPS